MTACECRPDELNNVRLTAGFKVGRKLRIPFEPEVGILLIGRCADTCQPCAAFGCRTKFRRKFSQQRAIACEPHNDPAVADELAVGVGEFNARIHSDAKVGQNWIAPQFRDCTNGRSRLGIADQQGDLHLRSVCGDGEQAAKPEEQ
ncbi:MAG TPA: hypothetical protein PLK78_07730 [Verrucomicrobiota bacterium]|nr:hypothetical protein [Verrucomicrobiota bacterium]